MSNISKYIFGKLKEENMANKDIVFSVAVRGFHVCKSIWKPEGGEKLMCYREDGNPCNVFNQSLYVWQRRSNSWSLAHVNQ